jgi:hypothetical protein
MCRLHRKTHDGVEIDVAWIPLEFAVTGKFLQIKQPNGEWVNGWEVVSGHHPNDKPREIADLNARSQDHKKMRRASDMKKGNHAEMCD